MISFALGGGGGEGDSRDLSLYETQLGIFVCGPQPYFSDLHIQSYTMQKFVERKFLSKMYFNLNCLNYQTNGSVD